MILFYPCADVWKYVFFRLKTRHREAFCAFPVPNQTVFRCKIVKVRLQERLFCRVASHVFSPFLFLTDSCVVVCTWISMIYVTFTKTTKNRREIAGRKTQRILRRFFRVKIVSCTPCSGLRLILFWHVFFEIHIMFIGEKKKTRITECTHFHPRTTQTQHPANTWQSFLKHPTTVKYTRNHHFFYPNPCTTQIQVVPLQHQNPQAS